MSRTKKSNPAQKELGTVSVHMAVAVLISAHARATTLKGGEPELTQLLA